MKFIGAHVSASGGVEAAPVNASEIDFLNSSVLNR